MGLTEQGPRRLGRDESVCPHCGLPLERVLTLEQDWVALEPGVTVLAHLVPAEHRWITVSDGRVEVYGVWPPVADQRCRIEHRLVCSRQRLPDLWPWLTAMRQENRRAADRRDEAEALGTLPEQDPGQGPGQQPQRWPERWPDAG